MAREAVYQQSDPETAMAAVPREQDGSLRPRRMDDMVGQRDVIVFCGVRFMAETANAAFNILVNRFIRRVEMATAALEQ